MWLLVSPWSWWLSATKRTKEKEQNEKRWTEKNKCCFRVLASLVLCSPHLYFCLTPRSARELKSKAMTMVIKSGNRKDLPHWFCPQCSLQTFDCFISLLLVFFFQGDQWFSLRKEKGRYERRGFPAKLMPEEQERPPPAMPSCGDRAETLSWIFKSKSPDPYGNRRTWEKGQFGKTPRSARRWSGLGTAEWTHRFRLKTLPASTQTTR